MSETASPNPHSKARIEARTSDHTSWPRSLTSGFLVLAQLFASPTHAASSCASLFGVFTEPQTRVIRERDTSLGRPIEVQRLRDVRMKMGESLLASIGQEIRPDEIVIGFSTSRDPGSMIAHTFLMTSRYRLDGDIFSRPEVRSPNLVSQNALLFRFRASSAEEVETFNRLLENDGVSLLRPVRLSCVQAACKPLSHAHNPRLPDTVHLYLTPFFQSVLKKALQLSPSDAPLIQIVGELSLRDFLNDFEKLDRELPPATVVMNAVPGLVLTAMIAVAGGFLFLIDQSGFFIFLDKKLRSVP